MYTQNFDRAKQTGRTSLDERGMVSIMVTMILMIVMSLIVIGFAQVSRRNQRVTLDRQLSTQAFYAAETGVNDARNIINQALETGTELESKKDCKNEDLYRDLDGMSQIAPGVSYSCLLVNAAPKQLSYDDISDRGTIIPLITESGASLTSVKLNWQPKTGAAAPNANCPVSVNRTFSPTGDWDCNYGVVRVDLVPINGQRSADQYSADNRTYFMVPFRTGGTNTIDNSGNRTFGVLCNATDCSVTITGLNTDRYYMRVSSIYLDHSLKITATETGNVPAELLGAQIVVDATGKAQDVLRRIQVHMPITGSGSYNQLPDNALESRDSVCKRYSVMQDYFDNGSEVIGSNAYCQP